MGKPNYAAMADLYRKARDAGLAAGSAAKPVPMVVCQHADPLNDSSPVVKRYAPVMDGVCGFAWIKIRPARGDFVNWCKANKIGRADSYEGGYIISVMDFNQSLERKEKYAAAFADVLSDAGLRAYSMSRMD